MTTDHPAQSARRTALIRALSESGMGHLETDPDRMDPVWLFDAPSGSMLIQPKGSRTNPLVIEPDGRVSLIRGSGMAYTEKEPGSLSDMALCEWLGQSPDRSGLADLILRDGRGWFCSRPPFPLSPSFRPRSRYRDATLTIRRELVDHTSDEEECMIAESGMVPDPDTGLSETVHITVDLDVPLGLSTHAYRPADHESGDDGVNTVHRPRIDRLELSLRFGHVQIPWTTNPFNPHGPFSHGTVAVQITNLVGSLRGERVMYLRSRSGARISHSLASGLDIADILDAHYVCSGYHRDVGLGDYHMSADHGVVAVRRATLNSMVDTLVFNEIRVPPRPTTHGASGYRRDVQDSALWTLPDKLDFDAGEMFLDGHGKVTQEKRLLTF